MELPRCVYTWNATFLSKYSFLHFVNMLSMHATIDNLQFRQEIVTLMRLL